ncbi:hypothetical protein BDV96DRAFT_655625 [Lophiotrema nucula]|uniref:Uncharacterized protein n=1 Tax=Lophiotrema nucula TaxID=690887 RepID=A0A6A5YE80_9PLEO|nr:hypothetical protein BDV96DRAFT_655625 [Lophiotrema nucula]
MAIAPMHDDRRNSDNYCLCQSIGYGRQRYHLLRAEIMGPFQRSLKGAKINKSLFELLNGHEQYVENIYIHDYNLGAETDRDYPAHKLETGPDEPVAFYFHAYVDSGWFLGRPEWASKQKEQSSFTLKIFLKDHGHPEKIQHLRTVECILVLKDLVMTLRPDLTSHALCIWPDQTGSPEENLGPAASLSIPITTSEEWSGHSLYFGNVFDTTKVTSDGKMSPEDLLEAARAYPVQNPKLKQGDHVFVGITLRTHWGGFKDEEKTQANPQGCKLHLEEVYLITKADEVSNVPAVPKISKIPDSPGRRAAKNSARRARQNQQQEEIRGESNRLRARRTAGKRQVTGRERPAPGSSSSQSPPWE